MKPDICWEHNYCVEEMNRFYDAHVKGHPMAHHIAKFTELLGRINETDTDLLDIGTVTAAISEYCRNFSFYGADLPHILAGCSIRNYPEYFYKAMDIQKDDLSWIYNFNVLVLNAVIDIMEHPLDILGKVLSNASRWVIIHRQEITTTGQTRAILKGSYGGKTWHSIISREDFEGTLRAYGFRIIKEVQLNFGDWEDGGRSFLLVRNQSYSIHDMDIKLLKYLKDIKNGIFFEAGANDGMTQSVTMYYEHLLDWSGILVEAITPLAEECKANRSTKTFIENAALVSPRYDKKTIDINFHVKSSGLMSSINPVHYREEEEVEKIVCPTMTLDEVLEKHKIRFPRIDLMVLDVEGYEDKVLEDFDFQKWDITYILIEDKRGIRDILLPYYDQIDQLSEHDYLFKRK